mgnify:CR=1 FL=1
MCDTKPGMTTIASALKSVGYETSLVGKFMNGWAPELGAPAGWDRFTPLKQRVYNAYDFSS